jgi:hypothetical protein
MTTDTLTYTDPDWLVAARRAGPGLPYTRRARQQRAAARAVDNLRQAQAEERARVARELNRLIVQVQQPDIVNDLEAALWAVRRRKGALAG